MAIGANSYGTVAEVAALVGRYTSSGSFGAGTRPTTTQVEQFIDRVSGIINVFLAEAGFTIPVSQTDAKLALDEFVISQATLLAHAANGAGPYAPNSRKLRDTRTPSWLIMGEASDFVSTHADGLEALGATRTRLLTYGLGCRLTDDSGDKIEPMFQRKQFGNTIVDWDIDE